MGNGHSWALTAFRIGAERVERLLVIAHLDMSVTSTSRAPISARSMPISRVTPAPKRTLDTAISNAMS